MAAGDASEGDEFTQAAAWLASARELAGDDASDALVAALVNAMALAFHASAVSEAGGNMYDLVTDLPGLKAALRG